MFNQTSDPVTSPAQVVQRQLEAYNAHDMDAWLATYHHDAVQHELHGPMLARGHAALRARMAARFAEPDLHARLLARVVMDNVVVDYERITRNFPEGVGTVEVLCIYVVDGPCIAQASFVTGTRSIPAEQVQAS